MPESGFAERTILGMTGFAFSTAAVLVAAYSPLLATPATGTPTMHGATHGFMFLCMAAFYFVVARYLKSRDRVVSSRRAQAAFLAAAAVAALRRAGGSGGGLFAAGFRAGAPVGGVRRGKRVLRVRVDERAEHRREEPHPQGQPLVVLPCRLHRRRRFGHARADRHRGPSLPVRRLVRAVVAGAAAAYRGDGRARRAVVRAEQQVQRERFLHHARGRRDDRRDSGPSWWPASARTCFPPRSWASSSCASHWPSSCSTGRHRDCWTWAEPAGAASRAGVRPGPLRLLGRALEHLRRPSPVRLRVPVRLHELVGAVAAGQRRFPCPPATAMPKAASSSSSGRRPDGSWEASSAPTSRAGRCPSCPSS